MGRLDGKAGQARRLNGLALRWNARDANDM